VIETYVITLKLSFWVLLTFPFMLKHETHYIILCGLLSTTRILFTISCIYDTKQTIIFYEGKKP